MRIDTIHIDGFGALSDRHYELSGPLTLFYGPNEAGKSTTMAFIRAILFGFPSRANAAGRYEPARGGAHGGWLVLADDAGRRLRTARYAGGPGGRSASCGAVTLAGLAAAEGAPAYEPAAHAGLAAEGELRSWLGGISPELYRSLFAFGLSELQELGSLQSEEISGYLYSAGWGASGRAIAAAEKKLLQDMERLYKRRGQSPELNQTLKRAEELAAGLRRSRADEARYEEWSDELQQLDRRIRTGEAELLRVRSEAAAYDRALRCTDPYIRYRERLREWEGLPEFGFFPQDALSRFEGLHRSEEEERAELERLALQRKRLEEQLAAQPLDEHILAHREQRKLLAAQAPAYAADLASLEELRLDRKSRDRELRELLREIDEHWTEAELIAFPVTIAEKEKVREAQAELEHRKAEASRLAGEKERLLRQLNAAEQSRAEQENRLQAMERMTLGAGLTVDQAKAHGRRLAGLAEQWKDAYNEWKYAARRLKDAEQYEEDRQADERRLRDRQARLKVQLQAAMTALGFAASAAFLGYMDQQAAAIAAIVLGGGLALFLLAVPRGKAGSARGRTNDPAIAALAAELERAATQLHDAEQSWFQLVQPTQGKEEIAAASSSSSNRLSFQPALSSELLRETLRSIELWSEQANRLEQEEHRLRELTASCDALKRQLHQLEQEEGLVEARIEEWRAGWQHWLAAYRLPAHSSPATVSELFRLAEQGKRMVTERDLLDSRIVSKEQAIARFVDDAVQWFGEAVQDRPVRFIQEWQQELNKQLVLLEAREELQRALVQCEDEQELAMARLARIKAAIVELWHEASAENEEAFRKLCGQYERSLVLRSELSELEAWFDTVSGETGRDKLFELLTNHSSDILQEQLHQCRSLSGDTEAALSELREQRGRLAGELAKLEDGEEHADRLQKHTEAQSELHDQIRRWGTLALSAALFQSARERYERDRQPGVLRRASEHIQAMTEGRYVRVVALLGTNQLHVQRSDGDMLDPAYLSRGTAEQLYLSIRFALAEEYARSKETLPLVLDDIFVNFDRKRLDHALLTLSEVSKRHQILLFTCHAYLKEAVEEVIPGHQLYHLED
jgi:uncharacterized protein YhaN